MAGTLIAPAKIKFTSLPKRKLHKETAQRWKYGVTEYKGETVEVAQYCDSRGNVVAQKVRTPDKKFLVAGDIKKAALFGQHLWKPGGKRIVVTEGEIDALSMSQALNLKWPVVSIPAGAQSAKAALKKNLEFLESFEHVVLMFDSDEAGQKAMSECSALFSPGKCCIAQLPLKDANEMLVSGRSEELVNIMWQAAPYRPDGILSSEEAWNKMMETKELESVPWPWAGLDAKLLGIRTSEIVTFCAGTGSGKSQVCRELEAYLPQVIPQEDKIGIIALEESVKRSMLGVLSVLADKPLHIKNSLSDAKLRALYDKHIKDRIYFYDHFGSLESDVLLSKIRFMAKGLGCKYIILDHISIVVSGMETDNERRAIDEAMTKLRSLVQETGVGLILVSHLSRPGGTGHEEGAMTSLSQLRGSHSIGQLSDTVIGLERNQQAESPEARNLTTVRVLKCRLVGDLGPACLLKYDKKTGRLSEIANDFDSEPDEDADDVGDEFDEVVKPSPNPKAKPRIKVKLKAAPKAKPKPKKKARA